MAYGNTNILQARDTYSRHYGDFRGVDFSSDHTQVHEARLAYLVNMYKDYGSGQGKALETVPGFRRRVVLQGAPRIFGIHELKRANGETKILLHAGKRLYLWDNYPRSVGVVCKESVTLPEGENVSEALFSYTIPLGSHVASVVGIAKVSGEDITMNMTGFDTETHTLTLARSDLSAGDVLTVSFYEGTITAEDAKFTDMNEQKSTSFLFHNRLYLLDGKNYLCFDGNSVFPVSEAAYIPTTYINIIPEGENADIGTEYEQRNILSPYFKHTFLANGTATEFYMNENALDAIREVKVYGVTKTEGTDYTADLATGKITFMEAPAKPEDAEGSFPAYYAGIEVTAEKSMTTLQGVTETENSLSSLITGCTIAATFDGRVFLSGNPAFPCHIFYTARNLTGNADPSYFGVLCYMQDGVTPVPITGMIPVADTLAVLKGDTRQDGSTYFHTAMETGEDLHPKIYPAAQGLSGIGCLGACINFLDDPIFVSRLGVEAIGQLSVRYERAIEHRSSLIDAVLCNMKLSDAVLEEWNGYLLLLCEGKLFMADSRQKYTHDIGTPQYEWYYLEDIGIFEGQYPEYKYASQMYSELQRKTVRYCPVCGKSAASCACGHDDNIIEIPIRLADAVRDPETDETHDLTATVANPPNAEGREDATVFDEKFTFSADGGSYELSLPYAVHPLYDGEGEIVSYVAYLCEKRGNFTGGIFRPAITLKTIDSNIVFGTENGVICSFNFDQRDENGEFAPQYYHFDERTIFSGCATKMDSCGIPHMNKNTVKKSTVIKTKVFPSSAAKIKVRTNRKPYARIARINSTLFSFTGMDFSDFSFITAEQSLFAIKEKEKKWVEKQYYIYSDEYMKPFALFYISFRYNISGRYKE